MGDDRNSCSYPLPRVSPHSCMAFGDGLAALLKGDRWHQGGRLAREHVSEVFRIKRAIDLHLEAYREQIAALGAI